MNMIATRAGRAPRQFSVEDYNSMGRMGVMRPDERLALKRGEIIVMSRGAGQPNVNGQTLGRVPFSLPLGERRRTVAWSMN